MNRHKFLIRHFPEGVKTGKSTRHYDEVQILERSGGDAFIYSQTQKLFVPNFFIKKNEENPSPVWGFLLDDSQSVQSTYPVLVMILMTDSVQEQLEKFQLLDLITVSISTSIAVKAKEEEVESCDPSSDTMGRPVGWIFDHWTCQNR